MRLRLASQWPWMVVVVATAWLLSGATLSEIRQVGAKRQLLGHALSAGGCPMLQAPAGVCGSAQESKLGLQSPHLDGNEAGLEPGSYLAMVSALCSREGPGGDMRGRSSDQPAGLDPLDVYALGCARYARLDLAAATQSWSQAGAAARFVQLGERCSGSAPALARADYDLALATSEIGGAALLQDLVWYYSSLEPSDQLRMALKRYQAIGDQAAPMYYLTVGRALLALGANDEAIDSLMRAADLDPESWTPWFWAGMAYSEAGDLDLARQMYEQGLVIEPGEGLLMVRLGDLLRARGDWDGAYTWYHQASKIESSAAKAVASMCRVRLDQERFLEAFELANRLLALDSRAYAWELASRAAEGAGELRQARTSMERALELDPENEDYLESLSTLCAKEDSAGCPDPAQGEDGQ